MNAMNATNAPLPRKCELLGCPNIFEPAAHNQRFCCTRHRNMAAALMRGGSHKRGRGVRKRIQSLIPKAASCEACGRTYKPRQRNQRFCRESCRKPGYTPLQRQLFRDENGLVELTNTKREYAQYYCLINSIKDASAAGELDTEIRLREELQKILDLHPYLVQVYLKGEVNVISQ